MQKGKKIQVSSDIRKRRPMVGTTQENGCQKNIYTSRASRTKFVVNAEPDENATLDPDFFHILTRHTWHLYRLSVVHNISYTQVKLKQYAARIKQALAMNDQNGSDNIPFSATVAVLPTMGNNDASESLQIEVAQQNKDGKILPKYRGVLVFWGDDSEFEEYNLKQMPFLLCAGTISVTRIVHNTLQEIFDTVIRAIKISQEDIMWLSLLNGFSYKSRRKKEATNVQFCYTIPNQPPRNSIKISLRSDFLHKIWNKFHPSDSKEILSSEKDIFYKTLNEELRNCFSIKFDMLHLHKIVSSDVTVYSVGRVKFHTEEGISKTLNFLQIISIILEGPFPAMTVRSV